MALGSKKEDNDKEEAEKNVLPRARTSVAKPSEPPFHPRPPRNNILIGAGTDVIFFAPSPKMPPGKKKHGAPTTQPQIRHLPFSVNSTSLVMPHSCLDAPHGEACLFGLETLGERGEKKSKPRKPPLPTHKPLPSFGSWIKALVELGSKCHGGWLCRLDGTVIGVMTATSIPHDRQIRILARSAHLPNGTRN